MEGYFLKKKEKEMEGDSSLQLKFKFCLTFSVPFYALTIKIDHQ